MKESAIDRRVGRTRSSLRHALIALSSEKGFEALTVEEICDAANVGRSTFYAHYASKEDLKRRAIDDHIRKLLRERREEMRAGSPGDRSRASPTRVIFEHVREHRELCRAAVRGRDNLAIDAIRRTFVELLREEMRAHAAADAAGAFVREAALQFRVGAFISVLVWWVEGGAKRSPDEMDALFRRLCEGGAASAIEGLGTQQPGE